MTQPAVSVERPRGNEHRRLVIKIIVSVVSFFAAYGLAQLVPEGQRSDTLWNLGGSLFMAGVVFIAQFLFEVQHQLDTVAYKFDQRLDAMEYNFEHHVTQTDNRLDDHARATERQMAEGLSKIQLATVLFDQQHSSQLSADETEHIIMLVRGFTRIATDSRNKPRPLVRTFAHGEISRLATYLKQLGDGGDLNYNGEDRDWLLGLTRVAMHSLQATSLSTVDAGGRSFTDGGLWRSELGQTYLEEQDRAIQRGVRIQRVFVIDRQGLALDDLHEVLEPHVRIGVEVRTLDAKPAPGIHSRLRDLIIFDTVLCYAATPAQPVSGLSPLILDTRLVTNPEDVRNRQRDFDQLWHHQNVNVVTFGGDDQLVFTPARELFAAS